jgi:hypothetical protein
MPSPIATTSAPNWLGARGAIHPVTSRIDGVTVLAFASLKSVESFLLSESYAAIEQDERSIAATEAGDYWTGAVFTVVDQLVPERATAK